MGFFKAIKEIVSPVPSFGNTGPIKFRSMSFGTTDSLKAYLDAIQNSIESFGVDTLGTPVIKIKPAAGGGFKEIEQSSKMRLRALASRGGGGKLGIIKNADGSVQVTEITTQGQGQFFGYEFEEK